MAELTTADLIWNRACGSEFVSPLAGDLALEALLLAHGYVMNGGVFHAVEGIDAELFADAQAGYRYFGFDEVADLLNEAKSAFDAGGDLELLEAEFDDQYGELIPEDSVLIERFEDHLRQNPAEFEPP